MGFWLLAGRTRRHVAYSGKSGNHDAGKDPSQQAPKEKKDGWRVNGRVGTGCEERVFRQRRSWKWDGMGWDGCVLLLLLLWAPEDLESGVLSCPVSRSINRQVTCR